MNTNYITFVKDTRAQKFLREQYSSCRIFCLASKTKKHETFVCWVPKNCQDKDPIMIINMSDWIWLLTEHKMSGDCTTMIDVGEYALASKAAVRSLWESMVQDHQWEFDKQQSEACEKEWVFEKPDGWKLWLGETN